MFYTRSLSHAPLSTLNYSFHLSPREVGLKIELPPRILPSPHCRINCCLCFLWAPEDGAECVGRGSRPVGAPGPWHAALGAHFPISPETGLNGPSSTALALPHWTNTAAQRRALCPAAAPGLPSVGLQTGTRPGYWRCNSRQALALPGKKTFLCSHKRRYVPGYLGPHISMWELAFARAGVAGRFLKTLTYLQKSAHILITHLEFPQSKLAHISTLR